MNETRHRVLLVIKMRWAILGMLLLYAIYAIILYTRSGAAELSFGHKATPVFAFLATALYNAWYHYSYRWFSGFRHLNRMQLLLDLLLVTVIIHLSGGALSWFWTIYFVLILEAAFLGDLPVDAWVIGFAASLLYGGLLAAEYDGVLHRVEMPFEAGQIRQNPTYLMLRWFWVTTSCLVTSGIASHMMTRIKRQERTRTQLEANKKEFEVARRIQQQLFPHSAPRINGLDISASSIPAVATGGDYFDYISLPDNRLILAVGDVSGHGVGPALLMASVRASLRALAAAGMSPGEILANLNRLIERDTRPEMFVTLILACVDYRTHSFEYVNAGHVPGYIIDKQNNVKARLGSNGMPLGIQEDTSFAPAKVIPLDAGDVVLLLTDGITEARRPDGDMFGLDRAVETVCKNRQGTSSEILDALYKAVNMWSTTPHQDDMTALVVRIDSKTPEQGADRSRELRSTTPV